MLEAKDLYGIMQVMPLIAAVGDRFCGQQRACPTVTLFVLYVSTCFRILEVDTVGGSHGTTENSQHFRSRRETSRSGHHAIQTPGS